MPSGHNTDLRHRGHLFHVQTEDRGESAALIETRVYLGGEILHCARASYADVLDQVDLPGVREARMASQHHQMLRDIRNGWLDPHPAAREVASAFGGRPLLDALLDSLGQALAQDAVSLDLLEPLEPRPGARFALSVQAQLRESAWPLPDAAITLSWQPTPHRRFDLLAGRTDIRGRFLGRAELPAEAPAASLLRVHCSAPQGTAALEIPVLPDLGA
jgi:hypothetical protein